MQMFSVPKAVRRLKKKKDTPAKRILVGCLSHKLILLKMGYFLICFNGAQSR